MKTSNRNYMPALSNQFSKARYERKLSQKTVAKKAEIHQAELSKLERGLGNPSLMTLNRIAEALGMCVQIKLVDRKEALYLDTGIRQIVIDEICKIARDNSVGKVVLFGSRARGDYKKKSDIDLAVSGGNKGRFSLDTDEYTSTLLMFDVVDLDTNIEQKLRDEIERDGVIIYEEI